MSVVLRFCKECAQFLYLLSIVFILAETLLLPAVKKTGWSVQENTLVGAVGGIFPVQGTSSCTTLDIPVRAPALRRHLCQQGRPATGPSE